jgi:hypothetical protein
MNCNNNFLDCLLLWIGIWESHLIHSACLNESNVFSPFGLEPNFKKSPFHYPTDTAYAVFSVQPITLLPLTKVLEADKAVLPPFHSYTLFSTKQISSSIDTLNMWYKMLSTHPICRRPFLGNFRKNIIIELYSLTASGYLVKLPHKLSKVLPDFAYCHTLLSGEAAHTFFPFQLLFRLQMFGGKHHSLYSDHITGLKKMY